MIGFGLSTSVIAYCLLGFSSLTKLEYFIPIATFEINFDLGVVLLA